MFWDNPWQEQSRAFAASLNPAATYVETSDRQGIAYCALMAKRLGQRFTDKTFAVRLDGAEVLEHAFAHERVLVPNRYACFEIERKALQMADEIVATSVHVIDYYRAHLGLASHWPRKWVLRKPVTLTSAGPPAPEGCIVFVLPDRPGRGLEEFMQLADGCDAWVEADVPDARWNTLLKRVREPQLFRRGKLGSLRGATVVSAASFDPTGAELFAAAERGAAIMLVPGNALYADARLFRVGDTYSLSTTPSTGRLVWVDGDGGERPQAKHTKREPLVSVIVPHYNLAEYLPATLRSIAESNYTNLEVIVVDDASSEPPQVGEGVTLIRNVTNKGLAATRNVGIDAAKGDYILPLDADDLVAPSFVSLAVRALEADHDYALVAPTMGYFNDEAEARAGRFTGLVTFIGDIPSYGLVENKLSGASAVMRREALGDLRYDETLTAFEDWDLFLRLALAGHQFLVTETVELFYRVRAESMIRQVDTIGRYALLEQLLRKLAAPGVTPGALGAFAGWMARLQQQINELREQKDEFERIYQREAATSANYWRQLRGQEESFEQQRRGWEALTAAREKELAEIASSRLWKTVQRGVSAARALPGAPLLERLLKRRR